MEEFKKSVSELADKHIQICLETIERCKISLSTVHSEAIKEVYLDVINRHWQEILEWQNLKKSLI